MVKEKVFTRFLNDCLLINEDILVIGDIHLGYEGYIVGEEVSLKFQLEEILKKLDSVFEILKRGYVKLKKIVLLGDLKHEFKGISKSEWRDVLGLLDYLKKRCKDIVLIEGNHDNLLELIAKKQNIRLKKYYKIRKKICGKSIVVCFLHGHECFKQCLNSNILIIGHLHPSISLKDKYKNEKFKCFLKGRWKRKIVYILPSFSDTNIGYDLRGLSFGKGNRFVFIDDKNLRNFEVLIYNDRGKKLLNFGSLDELI